MTVRTPAFLAEVLESRRLLAAVALDSSFGSGGKVYSNWGSYYDEVTAIRHQTDGKIVVLGEGGSSAYYTLARYNTNGSLDTSFGTNGKVVLPPTSHPEDLAIQSDGKIIASGESYPGGDNSPSSTVVAVRVNSNGSLDKTFGTNGVFEYNPASTTWSRAGTLKIQPDGKILLVGFVLDWTKSNGDDLQVIRLTTSGALDTTFDGDGVVTKDLGDDEIFRGVDVQSDGKIILAGYRRVSVGADNTDYGAVVRLNSNGSTDASFGTNGVTELNFGETPNWSDLSRAFVLPSGKIIVGGFGGIARLTSTGQLDSTFGTGGMMLPPSGDRRYAFGFTVDGSQRIVTLSTYFYPDYSQDWKVARYTVDGQPELSFNSTGYKIQDFGWTDERTDAISIDSQGRIVVGGYGKGPSGSGDWLIARFVEGTVSQSGGSISGTVYNDANNNAKRDSGEAGVAGITVYNDANNNSKLDAGEKTAVTDANGLYSLTGLASGSYKIREILQSGWVQTTPANNYGWTITLATNQQLAGKDFGTRQTNVTPPPTGGSIAGTVWNDLDGDGVKDSNELGVPNITVYNDANNNNVKDSGELTTVTDSSGNYIFTGLSATSYKLRQILQSGWVQTSPANGYGWTITLASNQQLAGKNFGTKQSNTSTGGQISGTIFNDLDGDGVKDSNEVGVGSGWTVYIDLDNDSILDSNEFRATTDANGNWTLSGLAAGTYKVRQVLQTGWKQTTPTNNYGLNVTLSTNQSVSGKLFGSKKIA